MQTQTIMTKIQQRSKAHNVANAIISLFLLLTGIVLSALLAAYISKTVDIVDDVLSRSIDTPLHSLIDNITNNYDQNYPSDLTSDLDPVSLQQTSEIIQNVPLWLIGFTYIVPGLVGLFATCCIHKAVYVLQMVFSITTLVVMGILFLISIFALALLAPLDPHQCLGRVSDFCLCPSLDYVSCDDINSLFAISVAFMVAIVVGWILTLSGTIVAGILACRNEANQYGMMLHPSQVNSPLTFDQTAAEVPSCAYSPGTDQSELLKWLEPRDFAI